MSSLFVEVSQHHLPNNYTRRSDLKCIYKQQKESQLKLPTGPKTWKILSKLLASNDKQTQHPDRAEISLQVYD